MWSGYTGYDDEGNKLNPSIPTPEEKLKDKIKELEIELAEAVDCLTTLEWSGTYSYCTGWKCCPKCRGIKNGWGADASGNLPVNSGHKEDCILNKIIKQLE